MPYSLPRDPLAWAYAALLALVSLDAFVRVDWPVSFGAIVLLTAALYRRSWALVPPSLLLVLLFPAIDIYPSGLWKIPAAGFLAPLLLCASFCAPSRRLRASFAWVRAGRADQVVVLWALLACLLAALALILWALWTNYLGVATQMLAPLKAAPRWFSFFVVLPGFAIVNAAAEEGVYRGVLQEGLEAHWAGVPGAILALQASAFAAAHFRYGFPNGKVGYLMVLIYGLVLGWLRRRSGGILMPYLVHVTADAVIGATLLLLAA